MYEINCLLDCPVTLAYIGHVDNVIEGILPEKLKNKRFLASDFDYGFELASPQGAYNLGDCIMLNDIMYSSRTDQTRTERDPLMWGPEFVTSGLFVVPQDTPVTHLVRYFSFEKGDSLNDLYQKIYESIKGPFAAVGCIELANIRAESITRAPIDNENIFHNLTDYYQENEYNDEHVSVAIHSVVSNMQNNELSEINHKLSSVLYYRPDSKHEKLLSHTHALKLSKPILNIEDIKPRHAEEVLHLMDDSIVRYVNLKIYKIGDLEEIS